MRCIEEIALQTRTCFVPWDWFAPPRADPTLFPYCRQSGSDPAQSQLMQNRQVTHRSRPLPIYSKSRPDIRNSGRRLTTRAAIPASHGDTENREMGREELRHGATDLPRQNLHRPFKGLAILKKSDIGLEGGVLTCCRSRTLLTCC